MRRTQRAWAVLMMLGTVAAVQASTIDVPLDSASWFKYPPDNYQVGPAKGTLTNNAEGHLVATKTTATGGSSYFLGRDTVATYDLRGATLQYQWKLNGQGTYSGTYNGVLSETHGGLAYDKLTTGWSYAGSILIPSNTWIYTEYKFSEAGLLLDYSISKVSYGGKDFVYGTKKFNPDSWAMLATARPFVWIGDNYAAGAQFELAKMTVTAVPEPGSVALMLAGLMGIGWIARRRLGR